MKVGTVIFLVFSFGPLVCVSQKNVVLLNIDESAVASVNLSGYPDWIEPYEHSVWISNEGVNAMQRLNPETYKIEAEVKVNKPCAAFTTGFGSIWVASCEDKSVVRIDIDDNRIVAAIPLSIADSEGSIVAAEGSVWVLSNANGTLTRIDPSINGVIASIRVKPNSFAAMAGFGSIWITNTGEKNSTSNGSVQRIDPRTNQIVSTIAVGRQPRFLAVGENGVWTFNQWDGSVSHIDPRLNNVVATIACNVPGTGGDIAAGEGYVWVRAKKELLLVIDPVSNEIIAKFAPPAGSGAVRVGLGSVWISAHDLNKVWKINPSLLKVRR